MQPRSIVLFGRIFLFSIAIGLVSTAWNYFHWSALLPARSPPQFAAMMPVIMAASFVIGLVINLLLWYFIVRRGAEPAKWIFVAFFAIGLLGLVRMFTGGSVTMSGTMMALAAVQMAIQAVCVWLLTRPDAIAWFKGERRQDLHDTFS